MQNACTLNKKSSYSYDDLLASGRGELFGKEGPNYPPNHADDGSHY